MDATSISRARDDDALWTALARDAAERMPLELALGSPNLDLPAPEPPPPAAPRPARTPRPRTSRYRNVTRFDYGSTHGYFVRLSWKHERRSKFFSDSKYGDRLAALAAAIAWRDATAQEMGKPHGKSGLKKDIGIHRRVKDGRDVYEATWYEDGRHRRTSFSVRKHGRRQARALAIQARARALEAYEARLRAAG